MLLFTFATAEAGTTTQAATAAKSVAAKEVMKTPQLNANLIMVQRENWRKTILKTERPSKGCFAASFPETAWHAVACKVPPNKPFPPKRGGPPVIVGNGTDYSAQVTGHITEGEGSFDSVVGVTSENGGGTANAYSLQLNTQFFTTTTCSTSPSPGTCLGWEQFVYDTDGGGYGFIQYWMIQYGPAGSTCPAGWNTYSFGGGGPVYCWRNAASAAPAPSQPATSLGIMKVNGAVAGVHGAEDWISVTEGATVYTANGDNPFPDLGSEWQYAEFNVFGDGNGDQANFNAGSTIVVRTQVASGVNVAPSCDMQGFTGETNNLNLVNTPVLEPTATWPSIIFTESNAAGSTPATCAVSIGDTHITTFDGLRYDFQASGDFVLAEAGPNFVVQARQASGAPSWPSASVNKAVAIKMGSTRVAIYIEPIRVTVNGVAKNVDDGTTMAVPGGVKIARHGNAYTVYNTTGGSVRAVLNSSWMDLAVGLGQAPIAQAAGLLGNPKGNAQHLTTAKGVMLKEPVSFTDLYHSYADSWRVQPGQSLFTVASTIKAGIPEKPFFAADLAPHVTARAAALCKAAGITDPGLLEDCTLDNTVLKDMVAVKAFVNVAPPTRIVRPVLQIDQIKQIEQIKQ